MPFYRKKPVIVEAFVLEQEHIKLDPSGNWWVPNPNARFPEWAPEKLLMVPIGRGRGLLVQARHDRVFAALGDVIVNQDGDVYPSEPELFRRSYRYLGETREEITEKNREEAS